MAHGLFFFFLLEVSVCDKNVRESFKLASAVWTHQVALTGGKGCSYYSRWWIYQRAVWRLIHCVPALLSLSSARSKSNNTTDLEAAVLQIQQPRARRSCTALRVSSEHDRGWMTMCLLSGAETSGKISSLQELDFITDGPHGQEGKISGPSAAVAQQVH